MAKAWSCDASSLLYSDRSPGLRFGLKDDVQWSLSSHPRIERVVSFSVELSALPLTLQEPTKPFVRDPLQPQDQQRDVRQGRVTS